MNNDTYETTDRLVQFLYVLLRDYVPFGELERIMRDHVTDNTCILDSHALGEYTQTIADLLRAPPDTP